MQPATGHTASQWPRHLLPIIIEASWSELEANEWGTAAQLAIQCCNAASRHGVRVNQHDHTGWAKSCGPSLTRSNCVQLAPASGAWPKTSSPHQSGKAVYARVERLQGVRSGCGANGAWKGLWRSRASQGSFLSLLRVIVYQQLAGRGGLCGEEALCGSAGGAPKSASRRSWSLVPQLSTATDPANLKSLPRQLSGECVPPKGGVHQVHSPMLFGELKGVRRLER